MKTCVIHFAAQLSHDHYDTHLDGQLRREYELTRPGDLTLRQASEPINMLSEREVAQLWFFEDPRHDLETREAAAPAVAAHPVFPLAGTRKGELRLCVFCE